MTETIDFVALVQNNPLTKLHGDYGSKIIQKIQERFSPEIQQLYIANCVCYINYNSKTDFPVILDSIWKWMGYSRLDHCKSVLLKHFKLDIDYKIQINFPEDAGEKIEPTEEPEKQETRGRKPEYITMTINCFKKLCLKSKTTKAEQIHEYYVELEDLMNELVIEQATELQNKLLIEQEKNYKLTGKKIREHSKGDFIYIYSPHPDEDVYKIGSTINLDQRESTYMCSNPFGKLLYERFCPGSQIIEKTIHLIFAKFRINNREHFKGSIDFFVKKIDKLIDIIDSENSKNLKQVTQGLQSKKQEKSDIQQFIDECCEIGENYICIKKEIPAFYKIWAKTNNKDKLNEINKYFDSKFKQGKHFFENYDNSTLAVYNGIQLKEIKIEQTNEYDKFLIDCCKFGPLHRIDTRTLVENYKTYKKQPVSLNEISELKNYLSNHQYIFNSYVALNTHHIDGFWGIQLKDNNINYGIKVSKNRRKNVICINENEKEDVLQFESLTLASNYFKVGIAEITLDIKLNRLRNGYKITSKDIIPEKVIIEKVKKSNGICVYKYDIENKLIAKYLSITDAAIKEKIGEEVIRKSSLTEKVKNGYYWTRNPILEELEE